jgi:soluble lytic murein transglycosylase
VQRGDTLSEIARRFGSSTSDLRRWNHLRSDSIQVGQSLIVSQSGSERATAGAAASTPAKQAQALKRYTVQRGDTLSEIADRFDISVRDLLRWNDLNSNQIQVGQSLYVSEPGGYQPHVNAKERAHAAQLERASVASSQLRPLAQQLASNSTRRAYDDVLRYARAHTGEASSAAYLALGHAYLADGKCDKAPDALERARRAGDALKDYADYFEAKAEFCQNKFVPAQDRLQNFASRHPDSVLIGRALLLLANVKINLGDPQDALHKLVLLKGTRLAHTSKYLYALGRANQLAGNREEARRLYVGIYLDHPRSAEASQVESQIEQMGYNPPFTLSQSILHARALYKAGDYRGAEGEYRSLEKTSGISDPQKNDLRAHAALAAYQRSGRVSSSQLSAISDTQDEAGAIRMYLSMEKARDAEDAVSVKSIIQDMEQRFPTNEWTAEALMSAGNMALLVNDFPTAIRYYKSLADRFPRSSMASLAHWHAAWLTYRLGDKAAAAQLFNEQIARYPNDARVSGALYWRGVIYEDEKNPAAAAAYFKTLAETFPHYYYAGLARKKLAALGNVTPAAMPRLERVDDPPIPRLTTAVPNDDVHVERAKLLANAGLNSYIARELDASPASASWRALAEAEIYNSYGEHWRAMRVLKRKVRSYLSADMDQIPDAYWKILFPRPYSPAVDRDAKKTGLDPYLVSSLIRQETEFNPKAISYANAWGLMQLLPKVGRKLARQGHLRGYHRSSLLNPSVNLQLGTTYLKQLMDEFNDEPAYAAAAYNAGSNRVRAWLANGPYASLPEFVESIPFTQTREYVEAVLRNREIYRQLYESKPAPGSTGLTAHK